MCPTEEYMMRENSYDRQKRSISAPKTLLITIIVCTSLSSFLYASVRTVIPITPKPVGSGARALGQSAFIAVVDDATAASWNPAGLINLEKPEVSFVGAGKSVEEDYSMADPLKSSNPEGWSDLEINFMSYAHPSVLWNTDVVISINYHQVYDFGVDFNSKETSFVPGVEQVIQVKGKSKGALSAYTLAGGLSIPDYPVLTLGLGINLYTQSLLNDHAWRIKKTDITTTYVVPTHVHQLTIEETFDNFRAYNVTLGLLWDVYEMQENLLTLGLVYHTPFTASLEYEESEYTNSELTYHQGKTNMDLDFPASFGAGVNYRFSDSLSAAFDVEWKEWSKYTQKYADGTETSLADDNTLAYRLGGEHLFFDSRGESVFACRGGVFYEPRPGVTHPDTVPVYGFSTGLGWTFMEKFSLDFAYQYRQGEKDLGNNIDYKIKEDFFVLSLITYF